MFSPSFPLSLDSPQTAVNYYSEVNLFRYSHLGGLATTVMELVRMQVCVCVCVCVCACVCVLKTNQGFQSCIKSPDPTEC